MSFIDMFLCAYDLDERNIKKGKNIRFRPSIQKVV